MRRRYRFWLVPAVLALMLSSPSGAAAVTPYEGYAWAVNGQDVHSVNGYVYSRSIDGAYLPSGPFKSPESVFIAGSGDIYVVDTGNNRIVQLDAEHRFVRTIGDAEGAGQLNGPKGVFVKEDGTLYVADTKNRRIAVFDREGRFVREYPAPESPLLGRGFNYSPSRLVLDKRDYLYVVSDGNTQGLLQIDPGGAFKGFYGANHVGFSWRRLLIRLLATEEQRSRLATVRPAEFSDVDIDAEGFIYTTTLGEPYNQLKRLSPVGVDTLNGGAKRAYGDRFDVGPYAMAAFMAISVGPDGIMSALDLQTGKVFQYDKLGNFLFAFGGIGEQNGLFVTPADLDQSPRGELYVVDKGRHRVDVFRTTPFADLVHEASRLYVDGRYREAEALWHEVLRQNANYEMAYVAIGKALYNAERYEEAMAYFKLARARGDYSLAFKEYRKAYIREHFDVFFVAVVAGFLLLRFGVPRLWRRIRKGVSRRQAAGIAIGPEKGEAP